MEAGLEIVYRTATSTRTGPGVKPARDELTHGRLTILCSEDVVAIDDETTVRVWDYREQKRLEIDPRKRSYERCSLTAVAHERVSGLASVQLAYETLRAGGAPDALGDIAHAEAFHGLQTSDKAPQVQHESGVAGDERWIVAGTEVARVHWSSHSIPPGSVRRILAGALRLHPAVAAQIASRARVPAFARVECAFLFEATDAEWMLETVTAREFDVGSLHAGCELADALDESHAIARRGEIRDLGNARLESAHASVAAGRLLEGLLAVLAHALATGQKSGEVVRTINERGYWWTPARRFARRMKSKARATDLSGFRKHAGDYAHVLDVLSGEMLAGSGRPEEGEHALRRALVQDPGLAAAWVSLGELYAQRREFAAAWDCFEYARALCPNHPIVLGKVVHVDRELRARHPQLF